MLNLCAMAALWLPVDSALAQTATPAIVRAANNFLATLDQAQLAYNATR